MGNLNESEKKKVDIGKYPNNTPRTGNNKLVTNDQ